MGFLPPCFSQYKNNRVLLVELGEMEYITIISVLEGEIAACGLFRVPSLVDTFDR
jgi:hypothetical protein